MNDLAEAAGHLWQLAQDPRMPQWLARAVRWTAGDLLAEAERRGDLCEPPPAANDNGSAAE